MSRWLMLALGVIGVSCRSQAPARFLYVWAGTGQAPHHRGINFLAVIDANPRSDTYGAVLRTIASDSGMMPHHSEFTLPPGRPMFANDFMTGETILIDHRDARAPRVMGRAETVPAFRHPHSFARFQDSLVVATFQFGDSTHPGNPGGLALFDAGGRVLRTGSARDSSLPGARIRPYGITLLPSIDRVLTTSSPMDNERTMDVVQIWRLSDLTLLKTVSVPQVEGDSLHRYPFEVRTLPDGKSVFLNTYLCGFYLITGLTDPAPRIERVHALQNPARLGCSVPVLRGRYWIMPVAYSHTILSMDLEDPAHPKVVAELPTDSTFYPHWLSEDPGSNRIVATDQGDGPPRVMMIQLDPRTGALSWDQRFRDAGSKTAGVSFANGNWGEGITGSATPHAAVFVP